LSLSAVLMSVTEVPAAAEEAGEQVEGVVLLAPTATLFVLLQAFVPVLIVDASGLFVREGVVGFGNGDELVVGGLVVAVCRCVLACIILGSCLQCVKHGKDRSTYGFLSGWYCLLNLRYAFLISRSEA
jgi:hypothetical protein